MAIITIRITSNIIHMLIAIKIALDFDVIFSGKNIF